MKFNLFLDKIGLSENQNVIFHSSLRSIKLAFPGIKPQKVINNLQCNLTGNGSLIMPVFTYNLKQLNVTQYKIFNKDHTPSETSALTEIFRKTPNVKRTSSPTHSFALWGKVSNEISEDNSPVSPLGKGSVLEWLVNNDNSYVLMLGTDFSALSLIHYYEVMYKIPWYDFFPWRHMYYITVGVSTRGNQKLKEIPGCSKSFTSFEKYLEGKKVIQRNFFQGMKYYFIEINKLTAEAKFFMENNYIDLLCAKGTCKACDSRRNKFMSL